MANHLRIVGGYLPDAGDGWNVLGYGSRVGEPATIDGLYAGRTLLFQTAYTPNYPGFNSLINATDLRVDSIEFRPWASPGRMSQPATTLAI